MRRYETFVIIDPDLSDDGRKPIIDRISELIAQQNGTMVLVDEWGQRRLAYEIKSKNRGYYVRFDFCGDGPLVDEIERFCRIEDGAMKYMTVVLDKDADMEAVQKEISENKAKAEAEIAAKAAAEEAASKPEPPSESSEAPVEAPIEAPAEAPAEAPEQKADESEPSNDEEEPKDE